ncbi:DUF4124 domain-containing protein [Pseudomonas sp. 8Z]|uniref:DUF4124 domain-containing protein n=1 Tax=Pseudomonas sp. 8Z TaxID=2653166 RepID=UPI001C49AC24
MFLLVLAFLATFAHGQVYTWVDESGQKHFSSQPPVAQPNIEPVKINHGYIGEGNVVPSPPLSFSSSPAPLNGSKSPYGQPLKKVSRLSTGLNRIASCTDQDAR